MIFFVEVVLKQQPKEKKINVARIYVIADNIEEAAQIAKDDFDSTEIQSIYIDQRSVEEKIIRIPSIKRTLNEQLNLEFIRKKY